MKSYEKGQNKRKQTKGKQINKDDANRELTDKESALFIPNNYTPTKVNVSKYGIKLSTDKKEIEVTLNLTFTVTAAKAGPGTLPTSAPDIYAAFETASVANPVQNSIVVSTGIDNDLPTIGIRGIKGLGIKVQHGSNS
jgi:hypothetical protein